MTQTEYDPIYDEKGFCRPPLKFSRKHRFHALNPKPYPEGFPGLYWLMAADSTVSWKYRTGIGNTERLANGKKKQTLVSIPGAVDEATAISGWKKLSGQTELGEKVVAHGQKTTEEVWNAYKERLLRLVSLGEREHSTYVKHEISYRLYIRPAVGEKPFKNVDRHDWRKLMEKMQDEGKSDAHRLNVKKTVNQMYALAIYEDWALKNTYAELLTEMKPQKTKTKTEPRVIRTAQTMELIKLINPLFRIMLIVLAFTGLRISELCGLRWCDIDFDEGMLWVNGQLALDADGRAYFKPKPKNDSQHGRRPVVLLPLVLRALKAQKKKEIEKALSSGRSFSETDFVFTTSQGFEGERGGARLASGRPVLQGHFRRRGLARAAEAAGLDKVKPHDLRYTTASALNQAGVPLAAAARMLGHDEETHLGYLRAFDDKTEWEMIKTQLGSIDFGADDEAVTL